MKINETVKEMLYALTLGVVFAVIFILPFFTEAAIVPTRIDTNLTEKLKQNYILGYDDNIYVDFYTSTPPSGSIYLYICHSAYSCLSNNQSRIVLNASIYASSTDAGIEEISTTTSYRKYTFNVHLGTFFDQFNSIGTTSANINRVYITDNDNVVLYYLNSNNSTNAALNAIFKYDKYKDSANIIDNPNQNTAFGIIIMLMVATYYLTLYRSK